MTKIVPLATALLLPLLAGGCGLGQDIHLDLVGTWGMAAPALSMSTDYRLDGTFETRVTATSTDGATAGCTTRAVRSGTYQADADEGSLVQTMRAGSQSVSGCKDPAQNAAEAPAPATDATVNHYSYTLMGDTLRLSRSGVTLTLTRR
jgi:hypothetical protein